MFQFVLRRATIFMFGIAAVGLLTPARANNAGGKTPRPGNSNPSALPAGADPHGSTYAGWSQKWWLWDFAIPAPTNPTVTPGADCTQGQSDHVWFLYGGPFTVTCTVAPGTMLFLAVANTECSSLEAAPFFGATPADRAACAKAWIDNLSNLSATVDGKPVQNLNLYRVQTGDFPFSVPADNILGVTGPASGFSSGDGYYLMLTPMSPGTHTIHVTATFNDPFTLGHPVVFPLDTVISLTVAH